MQTTTRFFLAAGLAVLLDQLSKYIVRTSYTYTTNTGAAFGILQGQNTFLMILGIAIMLFIFYYRQLYPVALGLIFGGALGNIIDRFYLGYVVDFIDVGFWPSFNVADSFNVIGALLLAFYLLKEKKS